MNEEISLEQADRLLSQSLAKERRLYEEMTREAVEALTQIESLIAQIKKRPEEIVLSASREGDDWALDTIENLREIRDLADAGIRESAKNLLAIRYPQADIAEAAGVTRQTVSRWKRESA